MSGKNIEFLGWVDDDTLARLYARCRALVFPGEEDFGIVPVEAQASGRPVIAYGKGGALETVVPWNSEQRGSSGEESPTGILFFEPNRESLIEAVNTFERAADRFDPAALRRHAEKFSRERFRREIQTYIADRLSSQARPVAPC